MPGDGAEPLPVVIRPLGQAHDLGGFCCGVDDLDEFLRADALRYAERRIARVYVALNGERVVGYVALVADSLVLETSEKKKLKLKHRDPKYVPAVKVGRLATCVDVQGRGVATELLKFSVDIANLASDYVGCRLLTLDALTTSTAFYERRGFQRNKLANKAGKKSDGKPKARANGTISFRLDLRAEILPAWMPSPR